jgi:hypothetical protein
MVPVHWLPIGTHIPPSAGGVVGWQKPGAPFDAVHTAAGSQHSENSVHGSPFAEQAGPPSSGPPSGVGAATQNPAPPVGPSQASPEQQSLCAPHGPPTG